MIYLGAKLIFLKILHYWKKKAKELNCDQENTISKSTKNYY